MAIAKPDITYAWAETGGITDPGVIKTQEGWISEIPTFQNFNWVLNRSDVFNQHVNLNGIPVWDAGTVYDPGSYVKASNFLIYFGLSPTNVGNDPALDTAGSNWIPFQSLGLIGKDTAEVLSIADKAGAVNFIVISNALAGSAVSLEAEGTDPSVGFNISAKAGGDINLTANEIIANGAFKVSSTNTRLFFEETDAALDEKLWQFKADVGQFAFRALNDGNTAGSTILTVDRTGITVDKITLSTKATGEVEITSLNTTLSNVGAILGFDSDIDGSGRRLKRINCNDGAGNWNFITNTYFNVNEKYQTTGNSATRFRMNFEGGAPKIVFSVAPIGTADAAIIWTSNFDMLEDQIEITSPLIILDSPIVRLEDTAPRLLFSETDATLDNKRWDIIANTEQFKVRLVNDADNTATDFMLVDRTGLVIDSINLIASTIFLDTPLVRIEDIAPRLLFSETDATLDNKRWDIIASNEQFKARLVNDVNNTATDFMLVDRTGLVVDSINLIANEVQKNGLQVYSRVSMTDAPEILGSPYTFNAWTTINSTTLANANAKYAIVRVIMEHSQSVIGTVTAFAMRAFLRTTGDTISTGLGTQVISAGASAQNDGGTLTTAANGGIAEITIPLDANHDFDYYFGISGIIGAPDDAAILLVGYLV